MCINQNLQTAFFLSIFAIFILHFAFRLTIIVEHLHGMQRCMVAFCKMCFVWFAIVVVRQTFLSSLRVVGVMRLFDDAHIHQNFRALNRKNHSNQTVGLPNGPDIGQQSLEPTDEIPSDDSSIRRCLSLSFRQTKLIFINSMLFFVY